MVLLAADSLRQREEWLEHLQRAGRHLKEDTYITDQKEPPSFAGPCSKVLDALLRASVSSGKRLVNRLHESKDILGKGTDMKAEHLHLARQLQGKLHDVHSTIVELDDGLPADEQLTGVGLSKDSRSACRLWLKQAQTFVLHLQQELDSRSKDVCCMDWPDLFHRMFDIFKAALNGVETEEQEREKEVPMTQPPPRKLCRTVVPSAQLRYSSYWARKIAL